jgi:hypothetical protein
VSAAIQTCQALFLPFCNESRVTGVENALHDGQEIEIGTDLLIAAWSKYGQSTEAAFREWEKATIARLLAEITE